MATSKFFFQKISRSPFLGILLLLRNNVIPVKKQNYLLFNPSRCSQLFSHAPTFKYAGRFHVVASLLFKNPRFLTFTSFIVFQHGEPSVPRPPPIQSPLHHPLHHQTKTPVYRMFLFGRGGGEIELPSVGRTKNRLQA